MWRATAGAVSREGSVTTKKSCQEKHLNLAKAQSLRKVLSIVPPQVDNPSNVLRKDADVRSRRYFVSLLYCRGSGKCGVTPQERCHEKKLLYQKNCIIFCNAEE